MPLEEFEAKLGSLRQRVHALPAAVVAVPSDSLVFDQHRLMAAMAEVIRAIEV
jgi:hypothetical protein